MKIAVKTLDGKASGEITLDKDIFGAEVRQDILHQMVNYQLAARRSGNHKAKTRCEVSGTGKKPWSQKGTGRARAGDLKRNIDRGGAVVHGPVVRSHAIQLPKKIRQLAMKSALSSKAAQGKLIILDEAKAKDHKTKPMAAALKKLELDNALIDLEKHGHTFKGRSDTEVILAAIEAWGLSLALQKLSGMFAFALWDRSHFPHTPQRRYPPLSPRPRAPL